jgi:DNA-binding MarR family transcriptional regulator
MRLEEAIKSTRFSSEEHKVALNILYSAWWLKTALSKELKSFGLTHEQYNVLRILNGKHPEALCVRDIASRMIEKNSNVPRILDRLLKKKLIKRNTSKEDRRETVIQLTPTGLSLLQNSSNQITSAIDHQIRLTKQEAKIINQLLDKMKESI